MKCGAGLWPALWQAISLPHALELVAQSKLHDPRTTAPAGSDVRKVAGSRLVVIAEVGYVDQKIRMIENIEHFPTDLHPLPFAYGKILVEAQIGVDGPGTVQDIAAGVAGREGEKAIWIGRAASRGRLNAGGRVHKGGRGKPGVVH